MAVFSPKSGKLLLWVAQECVVAEVLFSVVGHAVGALEVLVPEYHSRAEEGAAYAAGEGGAEGADDVDSEDFVIFAEAFFFGEDGVEDAELVGHAG